MDACSLKSAVLVLGMHRSGTSSVAGALMALGGSAPLHLMPPQEDNERGFWESAVLTALNDEILAARRERLAGLARVRSRTN